MNKLFITEGTILKSKSSYHILIILKINHTLFHNHKYYTGLKISNSTYFNFCNQFKDVNKFKLFDYNFNENDYEVLQ